MYTLGEIKSLLTNEWHFLFIALFVYWILNSSLLVIVDTLCKRKIRNRVTANAVSIGLTPFVLIYTGSMMKFMPMFNHWHLGINTILSLLSVVWMITVYYLFQSIRNIRRNIMMKSPYNGWYLTRKGRINMLLVMGFTFGDLVIKTLLYRTGIGSRVDTYRSIQVDYNVIGMIHFNGPLPKWFINLVNFTLDCFLLESEHRVDYNHTIGQQQTKEDIVNIDNYINGLVTKAIHQQ